MDETRIFSASAISVLNRMQFDPAASCHFDILSGSLYWSDEFPRTDPQAMHVLWEDDLLPRSLLRWRNLLTLGDDSGELCPLWEQTVKHAPNWPGLRPERRSPRALHRLRAALRRSDRCLEKLENDGSPSDFEK